MFSTGGSLEGAHHDLDEVEVEEVHGGEELADLVGELDVQDRGDGGCHLDRDRMRRIDARLGISDVVEGSWSEWCADPSRPIEK